MGRSIRAQRFSGTPQIETSEFTAQRRQIPLSINLSSGFLSRLTAWHAIREKLSLRSTPLSMIEFEIT